MLAAGGPKYRVGDYIVDTARYRITNGDTAVPAEPKVFDLLVYLIRNRDRVLTREELFQASLGRARGLGCDAQQSRQECSQDSRRQR